MLLAFVFPGKCLVTLSTLKSFPSVCLSMTGQTGCEGILFATVLTCFLGHSAVNFTVHCGLDKFAVVCIAAQKCLLSLTSKAGLRLGARACLLYTWLQLKIALKSDVIRQSYKYPDGAISWT